MQSTGCLGQAAGQSLGDRGGEYFFISISQAVYCSEHEILREEVRSLQVVRAKLQARVQELEEEIKTSKQEVSKV